MREDRKRVLIFGASKGGYFACKTLKGSYEIMGFLDNSETLQGGRLLGKRVFSPSQLESEEFDLIVIASMYCDEIYKQLIDLGIEEDRIEAIDLELMDGRCALSPTKVVLFSLALVGVVYTVSMIF